MKKLTVIAALVLGAFSAGQAMAAGTATLKLTATILPGACNITVPGGETLSWGNVSQKPIENGERLKQELEIKKATVSVNCDSSVLFGLKAVDDFGNVTIPKDGMDDFPPEYDENYYRLVDAKDNTYIGNYLIKLISADSKINGSAAVNGFFKFEGNNWLEDTEAKGSMYLPSGVGTTAGAGLDIATTTDGKLKRVAAESKVFALEISPSLVPYSNTTTTNVSINGSATFEITYI